MNAQSKIIEEMSDALISVATYTAEAIKECDDPQVRHSLGSISERLNELIERVRAQV